MSREDLAYLTFLVRDCYHRHVRLLPGRRYVSVLPFMYSCAIVTGRLGDRVGYDDRWCYPDERAATAALVAWDGQGEPVGWQRHPASGRRLSTSPDEVDDDGREVGAIGVIYRRR